TSSTTEGEEIYTTESETTTSDNDSDTIATQSSELQTTTTDSDSGSNNSETSSDRQTTAVSINTEILSESKSNANSNNDLWIESQTISTESDIESTDNSETTEDTSEWLIDTLINKVVTTEVPADDDQDLELKASLDVITHDYDMNGEQANATEAPDMDPNSELVDENGRKDKGESAEEQHHEPTTTTTSSTITGSPGDSKSDLFTTRKMKYGELRVGTIKPEPKENLKSKVKTIVVKRVDQIRERFNLTEVTAKQMCLDSAQDSGYWCEGSVGKLSVRYFYRADKKTCDCFLYYGCLGNRNNFQTLKE
ncbi:unnamed protein product, partial [Medioppia subpectinata]